MTVRTVRNMSRATGLVRIRYRDSGVVMRMWGGCLTIRRRTDWGVSPVRTSDVQPGQRRALLLGHAADAGQGPRRLRSTSLFSALSGEI